MKYTCDRCKKELEKTVKTYGGYAVNELKDLCSNCWKEYIEIKRRHNKELKSWWDKEIIKHELDIRQAKDFAYYGCSKVQLPTEVE